MTKEWNGHLRDVKSLDPVVNMGSLWLKMSMQQPIQQPILWHLIVGRFWSIIIMDVSHVDILILERLPPNCCFIGTLHWCGNLSTSLSPFSTIGLPSQLPNQTTMFFKTRSHLWWGPSPFEKHWPCTQTLLAGDLPGDLCGSQLSIQFAWVLFWVRRTLARFRSGPGLRHNSRNLQLTLPWSGLGLLISLN